MKLLDNSGNGVTRSYIGRWKSFGIEFASTALLTEHFYSVLPVGISTHRKATSYHSHTNERIRYQSHAAYSLETVHPSTIENLRELWRVDAVGPSSSVFCPMSWKLSCGKSGSLDRPTNAFSLFNTLLYWIFHHGYRLNDLSSFVSLRQDFDFS